MRMIQETCVAEFVHLLLIFLGLGVLRLCPDAWGVILYALYVLLGNLPFVLIQRYNRPRLVHMLNGSRRRAAQLRRRHAPEDKRVLILSCNTGEGHNSCARAIKECFDVRGLCCDVEDGLCFISRNIARFMSWGHAYMYRHLPWLFRYGYRASEKHPEIFREKTPIYRLLTCAAEPLHSFIVEQGYDVVICTHIFAALMLSEMQKRHKLDLKTAFVATDYTGYPMLEQSSLDLCFVPDASLIRDYEVGVITRDSIIVSGIPVRSSICRHTERAFARRSLNIPDDCRHLLVMCGSMGCGPIRRLMALLAETLDDHCVITVVCGTNARLRRRLERSHGGDPRVRILGYTDEISLLMDSADLYLTKPGGLSISEAAVKSLPMVMINAVAGCEEYNKNFFLKLGLGVTAESAESLAKLCRDVLCDDDCLARMRRSGVRLHTGNAAELICASMLGEETPTEAQSEPEARKDAAR